ncbi:MAG: zinc ribbon domain-containing protein [Phycisphaerae bacterium]|nr:zinc ribbon domain-containing protein [Phycisphaerae bacterium]
MPVKQTATFCKYCRNCIPRTCPFCGRSIKQNEMYCSYCNIQIPKACPSCGTFNRQSDNNCRNCKRLIPNICPLCNGVIGLATICIHCNYDLTARYYNPKHKNANIYTRDFLLCINPKCDCRHDIASNAIFCPRCGTPIDY